MTNYKQIHSQTLSEKNKPILQNRMIRIRDEQCFFIGKNRLCFFK